MPVFESLCEVCGKRKEWFSHYHDAPDPLCCGQRTRRLVSRFGIVWCKPLSQYSDPSKERFNEAGEGHYAYRVRSSKTGYPEKVWIKDRQAQKQFCKEEGLNDPAELPVNAEISEDGKKLLSQGMPGSWV